jgi:pimeloyl-ACP methyl ester carboxylesterase
MAFAERHPELFAERVAGVAFVATSCGGLAELTLGLPPWLGKRLLSVERVANRRIARQPRLLGRPKLARPGLRWLLFGSRPRPVDVAATAAQVGRCHPASMVGFRLSLNEHERRAALARMRTIPTVVLAGGSDRLTPLPHARAIAGELPATDFVLYPGAGHMLPYERAVEVAAHLTALVSRC